MKANLKRYMAVMLAFMIGGCGCYSLGNVSRAAEMRETAEAGEYEEGMESTDSQVEAASEEGNSDIDSNEPGSGNAGEQSEASIDRQDEAMQGEASSNDRADETIQDEDNDRAAGTMRDEGNDSVDGTMRDEGNNGADGTMQEEDSDAVSGLTVPEKINLTLDPYEIEGRGQVYSEQHVFRNAGITTGKLTLYNFFCVPQEQSGVIVRTDREGIHDGDGKEIYVELMFGNGEAVTFLEDGSGKYEIELGAGEELVVYFSGELNENSAAVWTSGDIKVSLSYLWDVEEPYAEAGVSVSDGDGGGLGTGAEADVSGGDGEGVRGIPGTGAEADVSGGDSEGIGGIPG